MTSPTFKLANPALHLDQFLEMNTEYMSWVVDGMKTIFGMTTQQILGMPVPEYVASMVDKVCGDAPPRGAFYLVELDGALAGMGGLRRLGDGVVEIKRVYVRPRHRGWKLGEAVVQRLLSDARGFGYARVCLDSAPFMRSAHLLYENLGFTACAAYDGTEVPPEMHKRWRFMAKDL